MGRSDYEVAFALFEKDSVVEHSQEHCAFKWLGSIVKQRIGIHGFYGMQNLGDEALLQVFLQEMRRILPGYSPIVYCRGASNVKQDYGVSSIRVPTGWKRWFAQEWSLWQNSLFVLGGGGLLHDYGSDSTGVRTWLSLLRRSQQIARKTALFFIGVDEIRHEESRKLIADTIPRVDFISVRDQRSADYLRDIGVTKPIHHLIDPAILLVEAMRCRWSEGAPLRVAVCLRHWFKSSMETEDESLFREILNELAKSLDQLIEQYNAEIVFYPMRDISYDDDRLINRQVCERLKHKESARCVEVSPDVSEFIHALEDVDILIGMRLHSLILASAKGIPVIALEYMPKIREYMQLIGQGAYILPMETPFGERLDKNIDSILDDYHNVNLGLVNVTSEKQLSVRNVLNELFSLVK